MLVVVSVCRCSLCAAGSFNKRYCLLFGVCLDVVRVACCCCVWLIAVACRCYV